MNKVSIPGVAVGGVVNIIASNALSVPLGVYLAGQLDLRGVPEQQIQGDMLGLLHANPGLHALQLLIGALCTVLGGYVAAFIAKSGEVLNGALASFLCIAAAFYTIVLGKPGDPLAVQLALMLASPFLGAGGGWLRLKQVQHSGYGTGQGYGRQHHA